MTVIYTAVVAIAPRHQHGLQRGAPPDMLSGGGREILASYTAFGYKGSFSEVSCCLIDTLPHQSSAVQRGRGRDQTGSGTSTNGEARTTFEAPAPERVRCVNGSHVCYLMLTAELAALCVTDGLPVDEEAFGYLEVVESTVSIATAPLAGKDAESVRRAASLALIESINTWTSQANGGSLGTASNHGHRNSPTSPGVSGRAALEHCLAEAVRRLRIDNVDPARPSVLSRGGRGARGNATKTPPPAPSPSQSEWTLIAPRARRPSPRGPLSPGPRSGIALGGDVGMGDTPAEPLSVTGGVGDLPSSSEQHLVGVNPPTSTSPSNGSRSKVRRFLPFGGGGGWRGGAGGEGGGGAQRAASAEILPGSLLWGLSDSDSNAATTSTTSRRMTVPTRPDHSPPTPPPKHGRGSVNGVATNGVTAVPTKVENALPSPPSTSASERKSKIADIHLWDRRTRLSLGVPNHRHRYGGLERATSMLQPRSSGWDSLPSPEDHHSPSRPFGSASGLPGYPPQPSPPLAAAGGAPGTSSPTAFVGPFLPGYEPNSMPSQHQQERQWSPPSPVRVHPLYVQYGSVESSLTVEQDQSCGWPHHYPPHRGPQQGPPAGMSMDFGPQHHQQHAWAQVTAALPGGGAPLGGGPPSVYGPMDRGGPMLPPSPLKPVRSESDPAHGGVNDPKEYYANRTTVAEERLRRRRLEGLKQQHQQHSHLYQQGTAADWGSGIDTPSTAALSSETGAVGADDTSPVGSRGSSGVMGAVGGCSNNSISRRRHSPTSAGGRSRRPSSPSIGIGAMQLFSGRGGATSPGLAGSPVSSVGSPFRRMDGRCRTPPLSEREGDGAAGGNGWESRRTSSSLSQSPTTRSGLRLNRRALPPSGARSESVPARPKSWTGPRSAGEALVQEALAAASDTASERRSSPDGERQTLGILLPLDYSGMVPTEEGERGIGDAPLLRELDGMARNALKTQVEVSGSEDELLTVLAKFRDTLFSIPLPPPAAVDYEQALKDAQRESMQVNGRLFQGDVEELLNTLRDQVGPLVVGDDQILRTVCQDIMRASSRTSSGGDTYAVIAALLSRPSQGDLLTPSGAESEPIGISVDAAEGEVVITVENSFVLRRNAIDMDGNLTPPTAGTGGEGAHERGTLKDRIVRAREQLDDLVEQTAGQFRKITARKEVWGGPGWAVDGKSDKGSPPACCQSTDEAAGIALSGRVEVYLRLLDGSSKRRLRITCPAVERCPPECILLGAGANEANGTYELAGFRHGAPVYTKGKDDVTIARECLDGRDGWIIGRPPNSVLYGQPVDTSLPPELHWALMNGGTGHNPPPTLMMHSQRRAKERLIDIREMPTPRQRWAIGPNVSFPDDTDHNLVGSAIIVRPPTPASPLSSQSSASVAPAMSLPMW